MAQIHVLDQNTINQIAAGEVVERPASIVKELVENAIDASATAITIEIKGGGIDFIRITDNGCGIEKDQIRNAFLRHATSKIREARDLETVSSLGFRGEALSSVAAVAQVELITKTDEGISGVRYVIEGGEETHFEEIGCPEGTTLVVRNLFYNTPARRKFLKSAMTESGYVEAFAARLALSHPGIAFKFICDNKNKISTSGNGNRRDVIYHIYGRDIARNLLEVSWKNEHIEINGYIGKPSLSRGNRNYENYYVNGRYLKNAVIARGIEDGYKGHAMVHKFPFTALMIEMDPRFFDVNVHPAKMEMRFKNGEELYAAVADAVRSAFRKRELIPEVGIGKETPEKRQIPAAAPEPFEKKRREIEAHFQALPKEKLEEIARKKREDADAAIPETPPKKSAIEEKIARMRIEGMLRENREIDEAMKKAVLPAREDAADYGGANRGGADPGGADSSGAGYGGSDHGRTEPAEKGAPQAEPARRMEQMELDESLLLSKEARKKHRIIGQVFRTYWLVEYEDKLYFVDQHAAHEKVMYEKLRRQLAEKTVEQQMVAPPIILNFSMAEKKKYLLCQDAFASLGYQIEEFGSDACCIRAVPSNLYGLNQQDLFVEMLDQIDEGNKNLDLSMITDKLASMACKAAVKGNMSMSVREMDALLDQLMELENPYQCPHGRPTIISMTKYELEKKFKRVQS